MGSGPMTGHGQRSHNERTNKRTNERTRERASE
eukprot:SAG22_NODE_3360_length_1758_cov_2.325497_3_plen_32_part_01